MCMKIAVLGGSFNPPHYGHLLVAREVLKRLKCDEVWLMPCFKHAEEKPLPSPQDRLAMTRIALRAMGNKRIKASDLEIRFLHGKNYTADTVLFLQKRFPQHEFMWVFGSELVQNFPRWGKWNVLRKLLPLVIYPRPGFEKPSKKLVASLKADLVFLPQSVKKSAISSTEVRKLLVNRDAKVKKLIPPEVFEYISYRRLYGWID